MHTHGNISSLTSKKNQFLRNTSSFSVNPNTNEVITCSLPHHSYPDNTVAIVEPYAKFENQTGLCVTSAIVTLKANEDLSLAVLNVLPHEISVPRNTIFARITVLTPKQAEFVQPINPQLLSDYFNQDINTLIQDSEIKVYPSSDEYCYPAPENCKDPESLTGINRRIYDEIVKLKAQEKTNPLTNAHDRKKFLKQFPWKNSVFIADQKRTVDDLLLRHHHIFARHRLDIGRNDDIKVKVTTENSEPMYTQGPPTPIH